MALRQGHGAFEVLARADGRPADEQPAILPPQSSLRESFHAPALVELERTSQQRAHRRDLADPQERIVDASRAPRPMPPPSRRVPARRLSSPSGATEGTRTGPSRARRAAAAGGCRAPERNSPSPGCTCGRRARAAPPPRAHLSSRGFRCRPAGMRRRIARSRCTRSAADRRAPDWCRASSRPS